jgi:hypothetical protein
MDPAEELKLRIEAAAFADKLRADLKAKVKGKPKKKTKRDDELF